MDEQIKQEIEGDQFEQDYQFEMSIENNESVEIGQSKVLFKKDQIMINKFGAQQPNSTHATVQINPQNIKQIKKIGRGSAGEVWLAEYTVPGQEPVEVAIKQIPVDQKQSRDQFVQDLKAFINSNCPYIVKFYGCFYQQGFLNQVIEYMNMGSLRDIINITLKINKGGLLEPILAQLSFCILSGLHYLHKNKRQIHRDIKPENILINSKGQVKITDFGIFKQLDKTYGLSKTCVGTQIYMSPQRIISNQYNSNCDVWSFGLVLYQLATCRELPYKKDNKLSQIMLIKKIVDTPAPAFEAQDNRSEEFSHFLSKCLQKNWKTRGNVEELLSHPWLVKNKNEQLLKEYIKVIQKYKKKYEQN